MDLAVASAKKHGVPGAIAIVDFAGYPLILETLDNTMNAAAQIALGKAATAISFQRKTQDIEEVILAGRTPMLVLEGATPLPYVPLKGGHPVYHNKTIVGAIAVAGTMDAEMDEVVALEALNQFEP